MSKKSQQFIERMRFKAEYSDKSIEEIFISLATLVKTIKIYKIFAYYKKE